MGPRIVKEDKGRPISGSEAKSRLRRLLIEPTLDDELKYACRILGISVSEGIRRGVMMFVKEVFKHYYDR